MCKRFSWLQNGNGRFTEKLNLLPLLGFFPFPSGFAAQRGPVSPLSYSFYITHTHTHTTTYHSRQDSSGPVISPSRGTSTWQHATPTRDKYPCPPAGLEPTIPAEKRLHKHSLDRAGTGIGVSNFIMRTVLDIAMLAICWMLLRSQWDTKT